MCSVILAQSQKVRVLDEPQNVMTYKLYFSNNETYTIIDILDYSNISLAWGLQSALDITWLDNTSQLKNFNHSHSNASAVAKSAVILTNNSVVPFLNDNSTIALQNSLFNQSSPLSLVMLALSDKQQQNYRIEESNFSQSDPLTIVINDGDAMFLKNWTDQAVANNKTIFSLFLQVTSLNCKILPPYVALFKGLVEGYMLMSIVFIAYTVLFVTNHIRKASLYMTHLAVLKVLFCLFNYAYWSRCPWHSQKDNFQNDNFIRSFRVTLSTLYQTAFSGSMICMVMGYKISKSRLSQYDIKRILIVASCQYFVDSLYSIGSQIMFFGKIAAILLNIFSIMMLFIIVSEARKNFAMLNLRYMIVTQS